MKRNLLFSAVFLLTFFVYTNIQSQNNYWVPTLGPSGGKIYDFVKDSLGNWFVGTGGTGVYKSSNEGNSWQPMNTNLTSPSVYCLALDSNNFLFAGTSSGIFRSSNGGLQWENIYFINNEVYSLVVDANNRLFACVASSVWLSSDNGNTWTYSGSGLPNKTYRNLCIAPNTFMYVSTYPDGIYRSTNGGQNWTLSSNGLPSSSSIGSLIATTNNYIFAGVSSQGIYLSTNNGDSWFPVNSGLGNMYVNGFGNYDNILLAGTNNGIFKTTNYGVNWIAINNGFGAPYTGCGKFAFISSSKIFAGTYALGVLKSTNGGDLWFNSAYGINAAMIKSIAVNTQNDIFIAITGGIYKTTNQGLTFIEVDSGITNRFINVIRIHPNGYLFAGSFPMSGAPLSGVFRSTNNGLSWNVSMSGWTYQYNNVLDFAFSNNGDIYVASNDNVYKSTNLGNSWLRANNGITNNQVYSIAVNPNNNYVFAGTYGNGVFRSKDNGANWTEVNSGLSATQIMSLEITPVGHIFAGTNGQGVFRSSNNGENWEQVLTPPHSFLQVWKVAFNKNGYVFAGVVGGQIVDLGVWASTNNGNNWIQLSDGIYNKYIDAIAFDSTNFGFVGSLAGGLYKSIYSTIIKGNVAETPKTFSLEQNYPNPFNTTTKICYSLPKDAYVKLKVYNIVGREICTLANAQQKAGYYQYLFDGYNLPSGTYFYRLETNNFTYTKRMVLLK